MTPECLTLDAEGWLAAPGEDEETFRRRIAAEREAQTALDAELAQNGSAEAAGVTLVESERIPASFLQEAGEITQRLYGFAIGHIPGFFLKEGAGLLWGGCLITEMEQHRSFFLIRPTFREKKRWFCYDRTELFAHELCHAMRAPLNDLGPDEYFAYQTSPSRLRRSCGGAFLYAGDALGFLGGVLILFAAQLVQALFWAALPVWPFWILAVLYPLYLCGRTLRLTRRLGKARERLQKDGCLAPDAVLFRMTEREMTELGRSGRYPAADLRWEIVRARFWPHEERENQRETL